VEDAARGAERDRDRHERATGGDEPAGARVAAAQPRGGQHRHPARQREADEPAGLAAEARVEQAQRAGVAAEHAARAAAGAAAARGLRAARLPAQPAEAVVAEDQADDAVVASCPTPTAGRRRA
jgi:hypothetical protein